MFRYARESKSLKENDRKRNTGNKIYSPLIIMEGINFSFDISNDDNGPQKVVWEIWQITSISKINFPFSIYSIEKKSK